MSTGKHGSSEVTISLEDSPGGTPRQIKNFVLEMGAVKITANTEQSNAFGDSWEEHSATGIRKVEPITISGFWDTTPSTGPHAVLQAPDTDPNGDARELVIVFGLDDGSPGDLRTFTVDVLLVSYSVMGENGQLTKFEAELQPTGPGVWT